MPDMSANTYEDLNRAIGALGSLITTTRYGDGRKGIIPVAAMPEALALIADAVSVISYFSRLHQPPTTEDECQMFQDYQEPQMESTDDLMRKFFPDSWEDLGSSLEE